MRQSVHYLAQIVDPRFVQQSVDCLRNLWIHAFVQHRVKRHKVSWKDAIPERHCDQPRKPILGILHAHCHWSCWAWDNPWIVCTKAWIHSLHRTIYGLSRIQGLRVTYYIMRARPTFGVVLFQQCPSCMRRTRSQLELTVSFMFTCWVCVMGLVLLSTIRPDNHWQKFLTRNICTSFLEWCNGFKH